MHSQEEVVDFVPNNEEETQERSYSPKEVNDDAQTPQEAAQGETRERSRKGSMSDSETQEGAQAQEGSRSETKSESRTGSMSDVNLVEDEQTQEKKQEKSPEYTKGSVIVGGVKLDDATLDEVKVKKTKSKCTTS